MEKFDLYWLKFKYEEDRSIEKERPVLVLDIDILIPVAKITSHNKRTDKDYEIKNWKEAGLSKPSIIRFDKKELIVKSALVDDQKIGHLSEEDIKAIKKARFVESLQEIKGAQIMTKLTVREKEDNKIITEASKDVPIVLEVEYDEAGRVILPKDIYDDWD